MTISLIVTWIILLFLYIAGVVLLRKYRVWLSYYLFAVFGLVLFLVVGFQTSGWDKHIEFTELRAVALIANQLSINARAIEPTVIHVKDAVGWLALRMGIESSGIIEMSILIGLIGFYPAFVWTKKIRYLSIGLSFILTVNLLRIVIIVSMTHYMGRETIFLSHAVVGRLFFFTCVIVLFWYILTRPTIREVKKIMREQIG